MKIRIKGNSIRIRVSRSEVSRLVSEGYLEESTSFGSNSLIYALRSATGITGLSAEFILNKITLSVPNEWIKDWESNDVVGFDSNMPLGDAGSLYLLLEKDFVCLDTTTEDQSDNYQNPNKNC